MLCLKYSLEGQCVITWHLYHTNMYWRMRTKVDLTLLTSLWGFASPIAHSRPSSIKFWNKRESCTEKKVWYPWLMLFLKCSCRMDSCLSKNGAMATAGDYFGLNNQRGRGKGWRRKQPQMSKELIHERENWQHYKGNIFTRMKHPWTVSPFWLLRRWNLGPRFHSFFHTVSEVTQDRLQFWKTLQMSIGNCLIPSQTFGPSKSALSILTTVTLQDVRQKPFPVLPPNIFLTGDAGDWIMGLSTCKACSWAPTSSVSCLCLLLFSMTLL